MARQTPKLSVHVGLVRNVGAISEGIDVIHEVLSEPAVPTDSDVHPGHRGRGGALRDQLGMNVVRDGEQELVSSQQLSLAQ